MWTSGSRGRRRRHSHVFPTFEASSTIAAANGQAWTLSIYLKRVSSLNAPAMSLAWQQQNSSGVQLTDQLIALPTLTTTLTKYTLATTTNNASTAYLMPYVAIAFVSGTTYDETIRVAAPNLKRGADINDPPILQTTNAAATRGAPSMYIKRAGVDCSVSRRHCDRGRDVAEGDAKGGCFSGALQPGLRPLRALFSRQATDCAPA